MDAFAAFLSRQAAIMDAFRRLDDDMDAFAALPRFSRGGGGWTWVRGPGRSPGDEKFFWIWPSWG